MRRSYSGQWGDISDDWNWSEDYHQHYEVAQLDGGSYWVPTSSHPPLGWGATVAIGDADPDGSRPSGIYFWIPAGSRPHNIVPGWREGSVANASPPGQAP